MNTTKKAVILSAGYILCQLVADVTAVKIIGPVFGQFVPAAVFIYAITFTWRDLVHRSLGKEVAVTLVWTAGVANILMAAYFLLTVSMPAAPFWPNQEAYSLVLGVVPRIVVASIVAELIGELVDTEIYHAFLRKQRWIGVMASNSVALVLDSAIFCSIAFIGTMSLSAVGQVVWGQILIKAAITILSIPLIYLVRSDQVFRS